MLYLQAYVYVYTNNPRIICGNIASDIVLSSVRYSLTS